MRTASSVEDAEWRILAFTDLHVSARTLDRALAVLRSVREIALRRSATHIVCLGDFWDARGSLNVRQLDAVLDELHRWRDARLPAVFIPGNHDQVSVSGRVHGIRFAEAFANVAVATDRLLWADRKVAFLPWREDSAEQAALFDLPGDGWTIFAHAEVAGATTNGRHVAPGRVGLEQIHRHARACYVGHYHKRQRLGDRTWYLGSPFEHNFGEMGDAKGLALITPGGVEPEWIALDGFPKHHRITLGQEAPAIGPSDIVELLCPRDSMGSAAVADAVRQLPTKDVRPLPLPDPERAGEPAYALTLDQAVQAYVEKLQQEADDVGADLVGGLSAEQLLTLGRGVLSEIPEARAVVPLTPRCSLVSVDIEGFCAIRERVHLDLEKRGLLLIRGPVGNGKTAIVDAITWCLTERTSPRRAGSNTASFRGDEVVNDHAKGCSVVVRVRLADGRLVTVTRLKHRGRGSQIEIEGLEGLDVGVTKTDHAALVGRVIGLDYDLWRSCVSLGQGTVANFVTDADKRRKEQLAIAFGLTACPEAVTFLRSRLKPLRFSLDKARLDAASEARAYEEATRVDYSAQIQSYEEQRHAMLASAEAEGRQAKDAIAWATGVLAGEASWRAEVDAARTAEAALSGQLAQLAMAGRDVQAEGALSRASTELGAAQGLLTAACRSLAVAQTGATSGVCPSCGQATAPRHSAAHVEAAQAEVRAAEQAVAHQRSLVHEAQQAVQRAAQSVEGQRRAYEAEVTAARARTGALLARAGDFTVARSQEQHEQRRLEESRRAWLRAKESRNPFVEQQAAAQERATQLAARVTALRASADQIEVQIRGLEFWEHAFGPAGIPVLVLRTALYEIETHANRFLGQLLGGRVLVQLAILGEDLVIRYYETQDGETRERRYEQLSGGQRRCVEMAFSPFALGEMIFSRLGVRVPFLVMDELTTHLGSDEKPLVCELLRNLERETVIVIDHDVAVQGEFDVVYDLQRAPSALVRVVT